jgi:hypothetical protein
MAPDVNFIPEFLFSLFPDSMGLLLSNERSRALDSDCV